MTAELTPLQIKRLNREYAPRGKRICRTCRRFLPLTSRYFYYTSSTGTRFQTDCRQCHNAENNRRKTERYHSDPEYRARVLEQSQRYNDNHLYERRQKRRECDQRRKAKRLAARLAGLSQDAGTEY